ncbi:F-box SKIP8-like isoform X2 [Olea europaea subsp. europaea]|uniref:F-box SKIP8-like isoform X2 n=1 Tax=Olea europaea subsp. europaea TaxID=158383 RepID=A0A8S0QGS8_OLEEU|nr:F-box SKIP8-like isoform X2 [Olea europaea subsp. europaea]
MKASNFYALSINPQLNRSIFFKNGRFDITGILRSNPHKQCNLVVAGSFGVGASLFPGCHYHHLATYNVPTRKASRSCRVRSEDCGGILSGESILLNEQTLERELQIAIEEENYAKAAKIRDSLKLLQEDSKASVLAANARFYNSFRNGDLASMQALWSKGDHVCVVHPGVSGISSHDLVMGSWEFVWADYDFPLQIEIKDLQVHVRGDIGYVTCIEMVKTKGSNWGRQFATNVFERIDGQWFMSVHHASYVDL